MGRTKGDLSLGSRTLAERAAQMLAPVCGGVLISVRTGAGNPAPGFVAIEDPPPPGRGPLSGIAAAFSAVESADLLVLACDYPAAETRLLGKLLERLAERDDLVIAVDRQGRDHPLVGLWRRRVEPLVRQALAEERLAVGELIQRCRVRRLGPADLAGCDVDAMLQNVNVPDDLERLP